MSMSSISSGIESFRLHLPSWSEAATPENIARTKAIAKVVFVSAIIAASSAFVTASLGCGVLAMGVSTLGISWCDSILTRPLQSDEAFLPENWKTIAFVAGSIAIGCGIIAIPTGLSLISAAVRTGSFLTLFDGFASLAFTLYMTSHGKDLLLSPEVIFKNEYEMHISRLKGLEGKSNVQETRTELLKVASRAMEHYTRLAIPYMSNKALQDHLSNNHETQAWKCAVTHASEKQSKEVVFPFFSAIAKEISTEEKKYKINGHELTFDQYLEHLKGHSTHEEVQKAIWQRKEDVCRTRTSISCLKEMQKLLPAHVVQGNNFIVRLFFGEAVKPDLVSKLKKTIDAAEAKEVSIEALNKKAEEIIEATPNADDIYTTDTITALGEVGFRMGDLREIANLFNVKYGIPLLNKFRSAGLCTKADLQFAGILPTPHSNDKPTLAEIQNRLEVHLQFKPKPTAWTTAERVGQAAKKYFYFGTQIALLAISLARAPAPTLLGIPFGWVAFKFLSPELKKAMILKISPRPFEVLDASPKRYVVQLCAMIYQRNIMMSFSLLNLLASGLYATTAALNLLTLRRRLTRLT